MSDQLVPISNVLSPEIQRLLREVESYSVQVSEIEFAARQVSVKVGRLSNAIDGAGDAVLGNIQMASVETFKRHGAQDALKVAGMGLVVGGAAKGLAKGVAVIGGAIAAVREEIALARARELRKEVAGLKLASTRKLIDPLRKAQARLDKLVALDAGKTLSRENLGRTASTQRMLEQIYFGAASAGISLAWVEYLSAEFDAWLKGDDYSGAERPDSIWLLQSRVDQLLAMSIPTEVDDPYSRIPSLPQGMILALRHPTVRELATGDPWFDSTVTSISVARARAGLLPIGKRKAFLKDYDAALHDADFVTASARRIRNKYLFSSVALLALTGVVAGELMTTHDSAQEPGPAPATKVSEEARPAPKPKPDPKSIESAATVAEDTQPNFATPILRMFGAVCGPSEPTEEGCNVCPEETDRAGEPGPWVAVRSAGVHLQSADVKDRVITMEGCEYRGEPASVIVLNDGDGAWRKGALIHGADVDQCKKLDLLDNRQMLVCTEVESGQGAASGELVAYYVFNSRLIGKELARFENNEGTCSLDLRADRILPLRQEVGPENELEFVVEVESIEAKVPEVYDDACEAVDAGYKLPDPTTSVRRFRWLPTKGLVELEAEPVKTEAADDFLPILDSSAEQDAVPVFDL